MHSHQEAIGIWKVLLLTAGVTVLSSSAYAACILYEHRDYQGAQYRLNDGDAMIMKRGETVCTSVSHGPGGGCVYYEPSWNDELSSFRVTNGCTLTLYENFNRKGARFRSNRSYRYVGGAWNDEASEAYCSCR
ncbi:peptidase inhibitor family I36 protein [Pseudochelatococcus lubricantis]|uniref:peptidase inhibitor family I36 protein n=1 Tax=Pseudochelatococcus lubricantis TaxID=1538102 RepID=UPI0014228D5C|nr:peptidase inhibitor family I36 protein [Pseudochelatococcus lubricantis]